MSMCSSIAIDGLVHFLNELDSNARPEMFPRIMEEVVEICDILAVVRESDSRTDVRELLNGWAGGAAAIFRGILADLQGAVREQAVVADQIGAAAVAYRSIAERAQADSMAIAYDVADRMVPSGGGWRQMEGQYLEALGQMLVVGLAIKDIAGSKGMSLLDSFSSWSKDQGEDMQEDARRRHLESYSLRDAANTNAGTSESREVVGEQAADFIGSAREQIQKVREHAWAADLIVHDALRRDVDEIDADLKLLEVAEADDIDHVDDLGEREQDVYLEDIVHLKKAGEADMPALAQMLHEAHLRLDAIRVLFDQGIGDGKLAGIYRGAFNTLVQRLDVAFIKTRDRLYTMGETLSEIAGNYYTTEDENRRVQERLAEELENFDHAIYDPDRSARTGDSWSR